MRIYVHICMYIYIYVYSYMFIYVYVLQNSLLVRRRVEFYVPLKILKDYIRRVRSLV